MASLRKCFWTSFGGGLVLYLAPSAFPQASLVSSVPLADTKVAGPPLDIHLKFDRQVDGRKSGVTLEGPDGSVTKVTPMPQSAPESLDFVGRNLTRGAYQIRWHAIDGIGKDSEGVLLFRVK